MQRYVNIEGSKQPEAVEYIAAPPQSGTVGLSHSIDSQSIVLEVTDEFRESLKETDGSSALDLIDNPGEQIRKYGRVVLRRLSNSEA
ncbi:hypothetical protein E3T54_15005 [Cryobacterium sp. Sr8]|uniref:hypothetical protein n=1 Tax=Cryobacterium sp. Sr8 TaxID=1259203 RepID=UPI00106CEEB3|nr:hypothetical protein [Cryobacterium sp. Sr8]TFD74106.1 hypothetical protein E3T54_15005 [Cryobacterium sp. Sr8]